MMIINTIKKIFIHIVNGPFQSFKIYWNGYGKIKAFFGSLYCLLSFLFSFFLSTINYIKPPCVRWEWWHDAITVIPCILGFSLCGYILFIGFGDELFMKIMRSKDSKEETSVYMQAAASFCHLIVVQFLCLFYSIIIKASTTSRFFFIDFIGIFLFLYSIFTVLAAAFHVLNLANWFDLLIEPDKDKE